MAICPHAEPVHRYTTKPVSLFALSTHENRMDDDEIATALSPLGAAGSVVADETGVTALEDADQALVPTVVMVFTLQV